MKLRPLLKLWGCLAVLFFGLGAFASEENQHNLDVIKDLVRRNETLEALQFVYASSPPIDQGLYDCLNRWSYNHYLKYEVSALKFFRNRMAMNLQMPEVAIEAALDRVRETKQGDLGLPGSTALDYGNARIAAIEASKLAAKQKQFASAVEILMALEAMSPAFNLYPAFPTVTNAINAVRDYTNTPTAIPAMIRMANDFWIGLSNWAAPPDYDAALNLLADSEHDAKSQNDLRALHYAILAIAQSAGRDEVAEKHLHRLMKDFRDDGLANAIYSHAQFHFSRSEFEMSRDWFLRIDDLETNSMTAVFHLGLSEVYAKLHNEPEMLRHLELAAQSSPQDTHRNIMDASDTQQIALVRLGQYYQRKGKPAKALEYYQAWEPRSWCGNGVAQFGWERDFYISQCLISLGKTNEALSRHLLPHVVNGDGLYWNSDIPKLLVRIFEERNALPELRAKIHQTNSQAAQITATLAEIRLLYKAQDADHLIDYLKDSATDTIFLNYALNSASSWQPLAAAEALSGLDGREISAIEKRIDGLPRGDRKWAAYTLGLSGQPKAKALIEQLSQQNKLEARDADYAIQLCKKTAASRVSKK